MNGVDCDYCHLCPAGEIKRRKKQKQASKKVPGEDGEGESSSAAAEA